MRKDWEYKKLGEVCDIKSGFTPNQSELNISGKFPYYKVSDMNTIGNTVYLDITENYIKDSKKFFVKGGIAFPKNGASVSTNKKRILKHDSIVDLNTAVAIMNSSIDIHYAYYWFLNTDFCDYIRGGALPTLDIKSLKLKSIPLPPKPTQEAIVAELDKLNEMIRLKKQQLEDYDQLAQSIFYEMFGDPVENEKGWEVKKLGEAVATSCTISYGIVQPGEHVLNGVPVVRPVDLGNTFVKTTDLKCTTIDISNNYSRTILTGDEILVCVRGTTGIVSLATSELKGCNVTRGITPLLFDINNKWFMYAQFKTASIQHIIASNTKGIALKQINMGDLRNIRIILPPLHLQQQFAARIEAIEQQKQQVKDSIKDLETLLASRMQYWFD